MTTPTFLTRTYQVEWVARTYYVDQYGKFLGPVTFEVACPTREDALEVLKTVATYNEKLARWDTDKPYHEGGVQYRERLIETSVE